MSIFKKKRPLCEVHICATPLPDEPTVIMMGEHEFRVCDSCAKLMDVLLEKFEERENDEQSL